MATAPIEQPRRGAVLRRRVMRSSSGGFSSGISSRTESLRASEAESDEVDDVVDPDQAARRIRPGVNHAAPPAGRENPRDRMNQVALAGSSSYAKEYRLGLLHRLLLRNVPLDQIAAQLQVSISTIEKDRVELKKRLREAATQLNIDEMVGGQNAMYDEVAGMAMRIASQGATKDENGNTVQAVPTAMRLAAMRTALAANADRTRFLSTAGVFDVLKFRAANDGTNVSDVQLMMLRTAELMDELTRDEGAPAAPAPAPRVGGFGPMTFDDVDASNSTQEIQEL